MAKRNMIWKAAAVLAATVIVGACGGSPQARSITLTFVRHAQSEANASGTINTDAIAQTSSSRRNVASR